jgi:hypothetical protein
MRAAARCLCALLVAACNGDAAPSPAADQTPADAGRTAIGLAAGEALDVTFTGARAAVRLATPTGTERFVAILASTNFAPSSATFAYSTSTDPVDQPTGSHLASGCSLSSDPYRNAAVSVDAEPTGVAPAVGAQRSLRVPLGIASETISAEVAAVSTRAVVWKDTSPTHPATLDSAFIADFLADFDKTILPRERVVFGTESDIDGNGRIDLVFTPLTKSTAVAFFFGCDLATLDGCPSGNRGEYLYLTPPADIAAPYNTPAAIKEILAHELGHLVHFNRKVLRNNLQGWPDSTSMIEGLGGFAQDAVGFQAGNLYVTQAGLAGIDAFSLSDVVGTSTKTDKTRDGLLRGGSYLFVRYLYDRAGGDRASADGAIEGRGGPAFLRKVLDDPASAASATPVANSGTLADVALDFYTTLAMSNGDKAGRAAPTNACFAYLPTQADPVTGKQRGADLFAKFHGQQLSGPATQALASADGKLRAGGVELLTVDASTSNAELGVTIIADASALPRVRIARVR